MTEWVGQAWKKNHGMKESIIRSFKKCGFSTALDGPKNAQVSIDGITNCEMPQRFLEEEFKFVDEDEDEDASEYEYEYEYDEFDLLIDQEIPLVVEQ